MKIYTGIVRHPVGEAYDGGFGPSVNVAIAPDDPAAPLIKDGLIRIYKKLSDPKSEYLYELGRGDQVKMAYNERGGKSYYEIIEEDDRPDRAEPEPSPFPDQAPPAKTRNLVVERQPDENMDAWRYIVGYTGEMFAESSRYVRETFQHLPQDQQFSLALEILRRGGNWWRPGSVLAQSDERAAFLSNVQENGGDARAWLVSAAMWIDEAEQDILKVLTKLGISSGQWLVDDDGRWNLLSVVKTYLSGVSAGRDEGEIRQELNKKYGVKLPVEAEPDPF